MSHFGMVGKFVTEAKDREALLDILVQASTMMSVLPDCQLYQVCKSADNDTEIWVMELWTSKDAHDQSLADPKVRQLISQAMPFIKGTDGASLIPVMPE